MTQELPTAGADQPSVLLAEDDDAIRETLAETLRAEGYAVTEVADGDALLNLLTDTLARDRKLPFDVVISDVVMPGYSAIDIMLPLRRWLKQVPVVLVTAHREQELHERCKWAEAFTVLRKPFDLELFCQVVWVATHGRRTPTS